MKYVLFDGYWLCEIVVNCRTVTWFRNGVERLNIWSISTKWTNGNVCHLAYSAISDL